jgi:hypothetical protein
METQKLRDASEHLLYEVTMFDATAHRLAAGMPDGVEENAFLESFTIHTRALLPRGTGSARGHDPSTMAKAAVTCYDSTGETRRR